MGCFMFIMSEPQHSSKFPLLGWNKGRELDNTAKEWLRKLVETGKGYAKAETRRS